MPARCQLLSGSIPLCLRAARGHQAHAHRAFSSAAPLSQKRKGGDLGAHLPKHIIGDVEIAEYPYLNTPERRLFKQANKGLYGGQMIQFGNNVSKDTKTKTRRHWKPAILSKSLYSVALKKRVKLRLTGHVLRIIDREGGLDNYLLKESESRIKELGPTGWALRATLLRNNSVRARLREEAAALGLPQDVIDQHWGDLEKPTAAVVAEMPIEEADLYEREQLMLLGGTPTTWKIYQKHREMGRVAKAGGLVPWYKDHRRRGVLAATYHSIQEHKTHNIEKRLAPTKTLAEKMAVDQAQKDLVERALIKQLSPLPDAMFEELWDTYKIHRAAGLVQEAGGLRPWLALSPEKRQHNAKIRELTKAYKAAKEAAKEEERQAYLAERRARRAARKAEQASAPHATNAAPKSETKDQDWDTLAR